MASIDKLLRSIENEEREKLFALFNAYKLSESNKALFLKNYQDLKSWDSSFDAFSILNFPLIDSKQGKRRCEELMRQILSFTDNLRYEKTSYSDFFPSISPNNRVLEISDKNQVLGWGKCPCPVDGEKTRCCKLTTLDAIMGCSFSCSYCSVKNFYEEKKIIITDDFDKKLNSLELSDDIWHIGTGQASDSLLYGNKNNILQSLSDYAKKHPKIVIEFKTKSCNEEFLKIDFPRNVLFTWSLNAETIIEKEEHYSASLIQRIEAAKKARDKGNLVGFHIHPMVYFDKGEDEYRKIALLIEENFKAEEIVLISMGTLTFTRSNLENIRTSGNDTRVTCMPLIEQANKYSYPLDIKEKMFSSMYNSFSKNIKERVFFYLCMEDPLLWPKVFGYEYDCDKDFENAMKKAYFEKINLV